ncbi:hypothetical protein ACFWC5_26345 [Streptomyces sp. NPDC060085]|uniref:hypothetical protein n=1 Tax=Streptomyces sp. NPDC060085 TaxID=3347054 RepID=UPI0036552FDA
MKIYRNEPASAPLHPAVARLRTWFEHLNHCEQDLVLRHVCAHNPLPLSTLAHDHALTHHAIRRVRNQLAGSLDVALYANPAAFDAVSAADRDLQIPTLWQQFVRRHPWLAAFVSERHGITVLQVLMGLRWTDAADDVWLFHDDLAACTAATLTALQLEPSETMSSTAVRRCLEHADVPVPAEDIQLQNWLTHCGLTCHSTGHGWTVSLAKSIPGIVTERVFHSNGEHIENETSHLSRSLSHALLRISTLLHENPSAHVPVTLGDILLDADHLPGELGHLARSVRDAMTATPATWTLGVGTLSTPTRPNHTHHAATSPPTTAPDEQERPVWLQRLAADLHVLATTGHLDKCPDVKSSQNGNSTSVSTDAARTQWLNSLQALVRDVLRVVRTPLSTGDIATRLQRRVRLRTLREVLKNDPQITATGPDQWALTLLAPNKAPALDLAAVRLISQLDSAVRALDDAEQPLKTAELKDRAQLPIQLTYLKQKLDADPRFQRSAKDEWALTDWDLPVYKPIKELVSDLIDKHGGSVDVEDVIRQLRRDFGINESSLRQVMSSPPFTARGGVVRRQTDVEAERTPADPATTNGSALSDDDAPTADDLIKGMGLI